jgi:hypothetical protein
MKKFLLLLFIGIVFCIHSYAQEFMSRDMEKYLSYCLESRKLIKEKKCDKLILYADSMSRLAINELDYSDFVSLQPSKEVSLDGHVIFTVSGLVVVAEAIINENSIKYNLHNTNRDPNPEINLAHRVIPAKSKMSYQIICTDSLDLLIFLEKAGKVTTKIISEEGTLLANCNIQSEQGWGKLSFKVGETPCSVIIELTNEDNKDICCAFAINGQ